MTEKDERIQDRVIAVTGAGGLIGRRLVPLLADAGYAVRRLARHDEAGFGTPVRGDLRDAASLAELVRGADAVVHLAGVAHTTLRSEAEVQAAHAVNVGGTRALVQAALAARVPRFLLISSAHVYAGQRGTNLAEDSPTSGDQPYAGMKLLAEAAVAEAAEHGMSVAMLRPCLTYGPGVRFNLSALMRALRGGYYVQQSDGSTTRSMASVDTVALAIMHLLDHAAFTGPFNVADEQSVQLEGWTAELARRMGVRPPRALPRSVLQGVATLGTLARKVGLPSPLTRASLAKLTEPFSLDVSRLASTGFIWPQTQATVLQQMIDAEFGNRPMKQ